MNKKQKKQIMLYAKITPTAKVTTSTSPFQTTTVDAEYMTAYARPYGLGATSVRFEVVFGNITTVDEKQKFQVLTSSQASLNSDQIKNWGIDDTVALSEIATAIGTTVVSTIELPDTNIF